MKDTLSLAERIVSVVLQRSVRNVTPIFGLGSVNEVLSVETDDGDFIVRLNKPEDDSAKMQTEYEKERWCLERAAAIGIPGPKAVAVGTFSGRAYMIQERLSGRNGTQSGISPTDLMRTLGEYTRRIHALPVNGFGDTIAGFESGQGYEGWLGFIDYNLGELTATDPLLDLGVYTRDQQDTIRGIFTGLRSRPVRIGLNHGDLSPRNVIVDETGRVFLLDWGCAEISVVPHYEFHTLLQADPPNTVDDLRAFRAGYGMTDEAWADFQPEWNAFRLLKAFDLTRWAIDRCPSRIHELAHRAASFKFPPAEFVRRGPISG